MVIQFKAIHGQADLSIPLAYKIANIFKLDARAMPVAQLDEKIVEFSVSSSGGTTLEDW